MRRRFTACMLALCLCLLAALPAGQALAAQGGSTVLTQASTSGSGMSVYALDLGNGNKGDAVIVEQGDELLLMDLGTIGARSAVIAGLEALDAPKRDSNSAKKLSIYFSHFHGDHIGGIVNGPAGTLQSLLDKFEVSTVYVPSKSVFEGRIPESSDYLSRWSGIVNRVQRYQPDCDVVQLKAGSTFSVGNAKATVIGPVGVSGFANPGKEPGEGDSNSEDGPWHTFLNNCSLVTQIKYGSITYLTSGDAREDAEAALVKKYGGKLKADIFKMAHHGVSGNTSAFLARVRPTYSFATNNSFTAMRKAGTNGRKVHQTYSMKQDISQYGLCYMIGNEGDGFVAKTDGSSLLCYRYSNQNKALAGGIIRTVGSYGENRGGGNYDFYDYYNIDKNGKPVSGVKTVSLNGVKGQRAFNGGGHLLIPVWNYGLDKCTEWCQIGPNEEWGYIAQKTAIVKTGWSTQNGRKYYLNPKTGYAATGIVKISGKYYGFKSDGTQYKSTSARIDGYLCKFNSSGVWANPPKAKATKITKIAKKGKKALQLKWKKAKASGYEIYMAKSKKGKYKKVGTVKKASKTTFKKKSLKAGKKYFFKVRTYYKISNYVTYSKFSKVKSKKL